MLSHGKLQCDFPEFDEMMKRLALRPMPIPDRQMMKKKKKTPQNIIVFSVTCIGMILCTLFDVHISSVWFILAAGVLGLSIFFIKKNKAKGEKAK